MVPPLVSKRRLVRKSLSKKWSSLLLRSIPEIPERRVGKDANYEARRELIVEATLDDTDDSAITCLVEVATKVEIFIVTADLRHRARRSCDRG